MTHSVNIVSDACAPEDAREEIVYQAQYRLAGSEKWYNYQSYATSQEAVDKLREPVFVVDAVRVVKVTQRLLVQVLQETQRGTM